MRMRRRRFLGGAAATAAGLMLGRLTQGAADPPTKVRPNVLVLTTDQQHAGMMSCAGNRWLKTPAMDGLAATGTRFDLACSANPVCLPQRTSWMTGHYPSRFGIEHNGQKGPVPPEVLAKSLGRLFRDAGYECVYGGKTHWPAGMTHATLGFENFTGDQRDGLADRCAAFLRRKHDKPFLLFASFINPHDICYMAIRAYAASQRPASGPARSRGMPRPLVEALKLPDRVSREAFFAEHCPPLPDNFDIPADEPPGVLASDGRGFRVWARANWTAEDWRLHRWAYARLTERVDGQIARVLAALRAAALEESTVVAFASDHGDMDAAHRLEHKSVFYEESARVPLIVSLKGVTQAGTVDREHLVSAGCDLLPTLCDYAGIAPPAGLPGRSVRALAEGKPAANWRDALVIETSGGRCLRTARHKYCVYAGSGPREQLMDLKADPGELKDLVGDPGAKQVLHRHRKLLRDWVANAADKLGAAACAGS